MKSKFTAKIVSVLLCIAFLISYAPFAATKAAAATAEITGRTADPATLNGWKNYFPTSTSEVIHTENAGGIWTDKSVMTGSGDINALLSGGSAVSMTDSQNGFLVALSALGSNMTVSGMAAMPTDTVIILDMSNSIVDHVDSMATAANTSLKTLFEANPNNRVAIVSYNSTSSVLLPLGRYSPGNDGNYLTSSTKMISIARGVTNLDTQRSVTGSITNSAGTYTQAGVKAAIDQLKARTVISGRLPVVILLTDGEPTIANTDIANLDGTQMTLAEYNSGSYKPSYAFLTQLTMAYMKQVAYPDMLFYTIGVGNGVTDDLMQDVINPDANISDRTLRNYWSTFNSLAANRTMTLGKRTWILTKTPAMQGLNTDYLSKITNAQGQEVNGYFAATSQNLAEDIEKAFESVMAEIISKSIYTPTLVQGAAEFSGYVSFVDKVGMYMEVDSIKGVIFDDTLHTGAVLASHFASENSAGGALKSYAQMSALGKQFIDSVATRLNVDTNTAYSIIQNAWNKGWISYSSSSNYSNWFGWLSNASGSYIGIWDGTYPVADPNAVFINRSYAMLGTLVNDNDTTDMMYSTIRVRERISTGEQEVNFAIPASLVPTITYNVSLTEDKTLDTIDVTDATPIRLVYEVKLDDDINSLTMQDYVDADYLAANTDDNGNVYFYSNQYETDLTAGYDKVNTYSYFRPSRQNDRYYYQNDSYIYVDTSGTKYVSATHPMDVSGTTFYYQHQSYSTAEGVKIGYHQLPADIVATAKHNTADNTYTITSGTVRADYASIGIGKASNNTGTLPYSHVPFEDTNGAHFDDVTHRMVVGVTLGNNGRITVAPASGIKLTKTMTADATVTGNETYTFRLTAAGLEGSYPAYLAAASGGSEATVTFTAGSATVSLKAGETISIGGMAPGTIVTVEEIETLAHTAHQVLVNGTVVSGKTANVHIAAGTLQNVEFINGNRSTGTFTVSKVIAHQLGEDYVIPENDNTRFAIRLELRDFEGKLISGDYTGKFSNKAEAETITFVNGVYTALLSHHQQLQINGLPEGSTVKATEELTAAQQALFNTAQDALYYENRQAVNTAYAQVSIAANNTSSVIVENFYTPAQVYPVNIRVEGSKTLTSPDGSVSSFTGGFTFQLQRLVWNGTSYVYEVIDAEHSAVSVSYNGELGVKEFVFSEAAFANEVYDQVGRYAYRVVEIPTSDALEQGVSFDATVHGFDVEVTDEDMDGKLEIKEIHPARPDSTNEYHETLDDELWHVISTSFHNHIEQDATEADIEIQKTLLDRNGAPIADASGFQFQVAEITGSMVADGDVLTQEQMDALFSNAETSAQTSFSGIARVSKTLSAEGTYFFAVRELKTKGELPYPTGYSFDTSVKFVKVTVGDNLSGSVLIATAIPAGSAVLSGGNYTVSLADGEANGNKPYQAAVSFTNTYSPASTFLNIDANKQLIGRSWLSSDAQSFTFELTPANDGTHSVSPLYNAQGNAVSKIIGTVQVENTEDGAVNEITFGTLLFKEAGVYFYDVKETTSAANGITPDATAYGIVVTVTDVNGRLRAEYVVINQESNEAITFVNRYTAGPAKYAVSGSKNFTGGIYYGDDFAFTMTNTADETEVYAATNNTDGVFTFPEITYNTPGTYVYRIEEIIPDEAEKLPGVSYNPEGISYLVTLTVADGGMGNLVVSASHNASDIVFTNNYIPKGTQAIIDGNKVLEGERPLQDGEFQFALYEATEGWNKVQETPLMTAYNTADGTFQFEALNYNGMGSVGIHRYLVEEISGAKGGVSYDTAVYRVAVVVTNDYATGSLHSEVFLFSLADEALDTIAFKNTYSTSGSISISGNKVLYGRELLEGEFAFDIYPVDDAQSQPEGEPFQTVYNNADGSFRFDMGSYTASGPYYFIIKEQNTGLENVVYDEGSFLVEVVLKDDQNGNLVYTQDDIDITRIDGDTLSNADSITFENEFMIYTSVAVDIQKTVINKGSSKMRPEGFEFLLERADIEDTFTVASDANGSAQFILNFTGRDAGHTYIYRLTEINTGVENVTYSEAEYIFNVTITIDENGELVATVLQDAVPVEAVTAEFINEYDYTPPDGPPTGDDTNLRMMFSVLLISALGIVMIALSEEKKNRLS